MKSTEFIDQLVAVVIDRPLGSKHPHWGFTYPVNYGYVPGVMGGDGEALDAYVLGVEAIRVQTAFQERYFTSCILRSPDRS